MPSPEISRKLNTAMKYHNAGRFPEAEVIYKQVIDEDPMNASALNLLGLLLCQLGKHPEGLDYIKRAVEIKPDAYFYKSLANTYISLKQFDLAIQYLNDANELEPDDATILFGIAIVHRNKNNPDKAIEYYKKALELDPKYCAAYYNLANVYTQKKDYYNAVENYKLALKLNPDDTDILTSLGSVYKETRETDLAIKVFEKVLDIKPNIEKAYISLGMLWAENNNVEKALSYLQIALEQNDKNPETYFCIGNIMNAVKEYPNAKKYLELAIKLKPDFAQAYNNLGFVYHNMEYYDKAVEFFSRAIELKSNDGRFYLNLGNAYNSILNTQKAVECYLKAIELNPDLSAAYNNLGLIYVSDNKFKKALTAYKKALALTPEEEGLYLNLGNLYYATGEMDKAMAQYDKAIELNPEYAGAYFSKAAIYFINNDYESGWKLYEWRIAKNKHAIVHLPILPKPVWNGSSLEGKTIYVYFEQAFGDSLQFVRYLPVLHEMGAKVIFKTHSNLVKLFKQSELKAEILDYTFHDDKVEYDTYIPLMSIPRVLNTNLDNIPFTSGYLKADKDKVEDYKQKFFNNDSFKIGIKWMGAPKGYQNRLIPLKYFYDLAKFSHTKIYSLQKGPGIEQLNDVPDDIEITDIGSTFNDFADTAAAIENMNLIICNDTSLAHLAGGLGKKTWILLPKVPEWRWMLDREDSPWYDSVRLFRQKEYGDWEEVMQRIIGTFHKYYPG